MTYQHENPVWRDGANYVNLVAEADGGVEQVWSRALRDGTFELCCIPFFLYDFSLSDIFTVNESLELTVLKRNGRFTYRVWIPESSDSGDLVLSFMQDHGLLFETYGRLIAIDAPGYKQAAELVEFLTSLEARGVLEYESGETLKGASLSD